MTIDQWDTLEAMMPFIIGINKIHYNKVINIINIDQITVQFVIKSHCRFRQ